MPANIKSHIDRLLSLRDKLQDLAQKLTIAAGGKITPEADDLVKMWAKVRDTTQDLIFLNDAVDIGREGVNDNSVPEDIKEIIRQRLERDIVKAEKKLKSLLRVEKSAKALLSSVKSGTSAPAKKEEVKEEKEEPKKETKKEKEKEKEKEPEKPKEKPKPIADLEGEDQEIDGPDEPDDVKETDGKAKSILKAIDKALKRFSRGIPAAQRSIFDAITDEVNRLDLYPDGKIRPTVKNLSVLNSIRNKINRVVLTDDYKNEVKEFAKSFNEITKLQNEYWKSIEATFKPRPLLKQIRKQAITDVVGKLTEAGIGANVSDRIIDILRSNITTGGSYKSLTSQLRDGLLNTEQKGYLDRYAKQVTSDSITQYSAQYSQIISSDLGYTWFVWDNTEIETSRPFCQHMCEGHRYFHISSVPNLLKGLDISGNRMTYKDNKTGEVKDVTIYSKTGLPEGFIPGTNPENFFVRRAGYNCMHQARPVSERQVPADVKAKVFATPEYARWISINSK